MNDEHEPSPTPTTATPSRTRASARCSPSSAPAPTANRSRPRSRPGSTTRSPCSLPSAVARGRRPRGRRAEADRRQRRTPAPRWLPRAGAAAAAVIVLGVGGVAVANLSLQSAAAELLGQRRAAPAAAEAEPETGPDSAPSGATRLPDLGAASFGATCPSCSRDAPRCSPRDRAMLPGRRCRPAVTEQPRDAAAERARCAALDAPARARTSPTEPPPGRCCTTAPGRPASSTPSAAAAGSSRRGTAMATGGWRAPRSSRELPDRARGRDGPWGTLCP